MVDMSMAVWVDSRLGTIQFLLTREGVQCPLLRWEGKKCKYHPKKMKN